MTLCCAKCKTHCVKGLCTWSCQCEGGECFGRGTLDVDVCLFVPCKECSLQTFLWLMCVRAADHSSGCMKLYSHMGLHISNGFGRFKCWLQPCFDLHTLTTCLCCYHVLLVRSVCWLRFLGSSVLLGCRPRAWLLGSCRGAMASSNTDHVLHGKDTLRHKLQKTQAELAQERFERKHWEKEAWLLKTRIENADEQLEFWRHRCGCKEDEVKMWENGPNHGCCKVGPNHGAIQTSGPGGPSHRLGGSTRTLGGTRGAPWIGWTEWHWATRTKVAMCTRRMRAMGPRPRRCVSAKLYANTRRKVPIPKSCRALP